MTGLVQPRPVSAICAASPLPDFEVCQAIWAFRVIGILVQVEEEERRAAGTDDDGLASVLGEND